MSILKGEIFSSKNISKASAQIQQRYADNNSDIAEEGRLHPAKVSDSRLIWARGGRLW